MQESIAAMLEKYSLNSTEAAVQAVREIVQEIALLGLWRSKFFDHAAFYGGTALRILHGLDRFSEDLDFTLRAPDPGFDLASHLSAVEKEIISFGFEFRSSIRQKAVQTPIQSAFLKANTRSQLITIGVPAGLVQSAPRDQAIRIRLEVDTDPPSGFQSTTKYLLNPIPFWVRVGELPDLFAGKMHAVLFRKWKHRVKGRDWYDFVWFMQKRTPICLSFLEQRMRQSGDWTGKEPLSTAGFQKLLTGAISRLDIDAARREVRPFLKNVDSIAIWSAGFFLDLAGRMQFE